jgi:hypothetical protein
MDGPDLDDQQVVPLLPLAGRSSPPGVVAGGGDFQGSAQQPHGPTVGVLLDEVEGHVASLAKKAVAFFNNRPKRS